MLRIGVVGLGKMGLSHLAIANASRSAQVVAVCDSVGYLLGVLSKYTGVSTFSDYRAMLRNAELDAVIIATPSSFHFDVAKAALESGIHVFCEKPLTLESAQSEELASLAAAKGLVAQVGYHNRFVATFAELGRLLAAGSIGRVSHAKAEAYGPVVLRTKGTTWRSKRSTGGGCLYDYAAHPLDLLGWYFGEPVSVHGTVLGRIFSTDTDDEVYSSLVYPNGCTAQLSVNWSDESYRKMTTTIAVWGDQGSVSADRQELHAYFRDSAAVPEGYHVGWNTRSTTELTEPVEFYLRGEEYSAQLAHFIDAILGRTTLRENSFASGAANDRTIEALITDAAHAMAG